MTECTVEQPTQYARSRDHPPDRLVRFSVSAMNSPDTPAPATTTRNLRSAITLHKPDPICVSRSLSRSGRSQQPNWRVSSEGAMVSGGLLAERGAAACEVMTPERVARVAMEAKEGNNCAIALWVWRLLGIFAHGCWG
jgi:hypothetical protein